MDRDWQKMDAALVKRMQDRLGSEFADFAQVASDVGLLRSNFLKVNENGFDVDFASAMCVSSIVSAANYYGGQAQLGMAKKLVKWALTLEPKHPSALMCARAAAMVEGDDASFQRYSQQLNTLKSDILAKQPSQRTAIEEGFIKALEHGI